MSWKLLRRRFSVSAPRMIVRSYLPWPLRWAVVALVFGFSAALALWAFEFGREIAGLDRGSREELAQLRAEVAKLRQDSERARALADTAESRVKTEQVAQERLAQQLRELEAERQALQAELGFFERLMPVADEGLQMRAFRADAPTPGQLRYQILVMQSGRNAAEFSGRYELVLAGSLEGRPWSGSRSGARPLQFRQFARLEGTVDHPVGVVLKTVQARVLDTRGAVRAVQTVKL